MKRSREIIVAVVVLSTLGILYFGYNYLKGNDVFSKRDYYYAVYERIEGLKADAPVQVNGFDVGRVTSVTLHPDMTGSILVEFSIENDKFQFPRNSTARIASLDLLGSRAIQLVVPDVQESITAMPGDTLNSAVEGDIQDMVSGKIAPFEAKVEEMMLSIDTVIQSVQLMFNNDAREALGASFDAIVAGFQTFELTAHEIDSLIREERGKIAHIIYNVDQITTTLEQNNGKLENFMTNMSDLSDTLAAAEINETLLNANQALADITVLMQKINEGQGTIGALMHDPELYENLTGAALALESLLEDAENNPHRYIHISAIDFHREKKPKKTKKKNRGGKNTDPEVPVNEPDSIP